MSDATATRPTWLLSAWAREFVPLAGSSILMQGSRFALLIVAASHLGPVLYGYWTLFMIVVQYSANAHLGVLNAMNRDVPYFRGRRDVERIAIIRSQGLGVAVGSAVALGAAGMGGALGLSDSPLGVAVALTGAWMLVQQLFVYLQTYAKSEADFGTVSWQQLGLAVGLPGLGIPLLRFGGLEGLIAAHVLVFAAVVLLTLFWNRPAVSLRFSWPETRRLLEVGFPIMAVGLGYALLTSVDRWVVAHSLGVREVGYYGLAALLISIVTLLPTGVADQFYPRMSEAYGALHVGRGSELRRLFRQQLLVQLALTVPVAATAAALFPIVIGRFLTDYLPAVQPVRVLAVGAVFLSGTLACGTCLNILDRQKLYLLLQVAAISTTLAATWVAATLGRWGMTGVALASSLVYGLYFVVLLVVTEAFLSGLGTTSTSSGAAEARRPR